MIKLPILWCSERHRERMTKELKNKVIYVRLDFGSGDFFDDFFQKRCRNERNIIMFANNELK